MQRRMEFIRKYKEVIAYLFWGVMTTLVSWGAYSVFASLFRNQINEFSIIGMKISVVVLVSNVLSWVCAVLFAFITNKLWVFQSKSWSRMVLLSEFSKFLTTRLLTGVLEIIMVPILVSIGLNQTIFGIEGMVAKVLVSVAVVLLNYIFSKLFIFK